MNVPVLRRTSVTSTLNASTFQDSMSADALLDIRAMAEHVLVSHFQVQRLTEKYMCKENIRKIERFFVCNCQR